MIYNFLIEYKITMISGKIYNAITNTLSIRKYYNCEISIFNINIEVENGGFEYCTNGMN